MNLSSVNYSVILYYFCISLEFGLKFTICAKLRSKLIREFMNNHENYFSFTSFVRVTNRILLNF